MFRVVLHASWDYCNISHQCTSCYEQLMLSRRFTYLVWLDVALSMGISRFVITNSPWRPEEFDNIPSVSAAKGKSTCSCLVNTGLILFPFSPSFETGTKIRFFGGHQGATCGSWRQPQVIWECWKTAVFSENWEEIIASEQYFGLATRRPLNST